MSLARAAQTGQLRQAHCRLVRIEKMSRLSRCAGLPLFALLLAFSGKADAAGDNERLQACLEMQNDVPSAQALACYRQAAQAQLADSEATKENKRALVRAPNRNLADDWTPSNEVLHIYKQNYFLVYSHSSQPNNNPTSPNPNNQAPSSYPLDSKEMKFQISVKGHFLGQNRHTLWFGYTQLAFWQIFDSAHSQPFREVNYEPELIYSYRPEKRSLAGIGLGFLNVAFVHQSNGQSLPRSRSWNRQYIQLGLERDFGDNGKLAVLPRWWKRLGGGTSDDDNPDITSHLGRGDLEARYYNGKLTLSALIRVHSVQFDLAIPPPELFGIQPQNSNLHLQYFNGRGESLIDYNQRHSTFGFGISMPFE
ncbi:MAG TPA: phospholipase A [Sideroxyarcus sp.]|nr:phospholipase A [Sideroxyarcus sp.]